MAQALSFSASCYSPLMSHKAVSFSAKPRNNGNVSALPCSVTFPSRRSTPMRRLGVVSAQANPSGEKKDGSSSGDLNLGKDNQQGNAVEKRPRIMALGISPFGMTLDVGKVVEVSMGQVAMVK